MDFDKLNNLKGFMPQHEGEALAKWAQRFSTMGPALEIGTFGGKSSLYIAAGSSMNEQLVFTLDHHKGSEEHQTGEEYFDPEEYDYKNKRVDTLPSLLKNISRFQLDEYIKVMVETSKSASEKIKNEIDFLFIDGSHTFESARADYESWKEKIRVGGILTIHDIYDSELEGGQAPREIYEKALGENFKLIKRVKSLVALEKIS